MISNHDSLKTVNAEMASVSEYLWDKGWAERNAGNMSVNVTQLLPDHKDLVNESCHQLDTAYPDLEGQLLLLSGTGTRMRDLAKDPEKNICMIKIGAGGTNYFMNNGKNNSLLPTSELPTHLAIHQKLLRDGRKENAILHAHVKELIALTQISEFTNANAINKLLWGMHPETLLFIPDGAGLVRYTLPGTKEIADKTLKMLEKHKVIIWEKHGCLAVGENVFEAFDQIDILAKSANIFFLCRNAGYYPEGMKEEDLTEIRRKYL